MKTLIAVGLGTIYGLLLRMMFWFFNDFMGIMSLSFLIISPIIIGFLTIILIPKNQTVSGPSAFLTPWLTSFSILVVTMLFQIEGIICWIMIYPLFSILAGIGGIIAFLVRKKRVTDMDNNNWKKPNSLNISVILILPAFIGVIEGERTLSGKEFNISKSVIIPASTKVVWYHLTNINEIKTTENYSPLSNMMGFPRHLCTTLDTLSVGGNRKAIYENGLYFEETISDYEIGKLLVLDINIDPNKIPKNVMDEHIVIGGKHVNILQDIYTIKKISENSCKLTLTSRFTINTPFNWYASIWSKYLMADILHGQLNLIKGRTKS